MCVFWRISTAGQWYIVITDFRIYVHGQIEILHLFKSLYMVSSLPCVSHISSSDRFVRQHDVMVIMVYGMIALVWCNRVVRFKRLYWTGGQWACHGGPMHWHSVGVLHLTTLVIQISEQPLLWTHVMTSSCCANCSFGPHACMEGEDL